MRIIVLSKVFNRVRMAKENITVFWKYCYRFNRYSYRDLKCRYYQQFEASITRLYHTIEKGLSYDNYRPGFGQKNIHCLIRTLKQYAEKGFDTTSFFYETALSCLSEYIRKNHQYGYEDKELERIISELPGKPNAAGGTLFYINPDAPQVLSYEQLMKSRHSIRHFSNEHVSVCDIEKAIRIAQHTPSACNRQCWKTRVVKNRDTIATILDNQNGNTGFGNEIDAILVISADLRAQQHSREVFQAYIDGGMYAESILNALFYMNIGAVPLSASLTSKQELTVRKTIGMDDAEVLILFIGIGCYPKGGTLTTRSERKPTNTIEVI